ncbi:squalene synthase HpnC [Chitinimonas sp. BJB300]|uniref:squalene synthase HpnC n=1 Tax=Chitinimonas sp. BJB300 TaxID=1559339 RepID=UPI000C0EBB59|nr:squalene synthase HpnC [Chitinimonas sp. BJB300]PHV10265.1 squalene synthase HpnC [Chitinimonas sp. BJB300]TSJ83785.1 squalene synthase HpnC [Chitinimonas sp. BJB300]
MPESYAINHYENFPVASLLLPATMRRPIAIVYRFARTADDFADEGERTAAERLALLEDYRQALRRIENNEDPGLPLFRDLLDEVIRPHQVPIQLFHDLLDAFSQDVIKTRFADFGEVMQYARRSANPVGRIVLHVAGQASSRNLAWSDGICAALQLINFWQDVAIDWKKDRVYLPQDELARFGVDEAQIAAAHVDDKWRALMAFQVDRTRRMLRAGSPLGVALPGRLGLEIRLTVLGGDAILKKIIACDYDIFRQRPALRGRDWPMLLLRALLPKKIRS